MVTLGRGRDGRRSAARTGFITSLRAQRTGKLCPIDSGGEMVTLGRALGVLLVVQFGAMAHDGGAAPAGKAWFPDPIEGVWKASVVITNCAGVTIGTAEAMGIFAANGTFHDTNSTNPTLKSSTFGYWRRLGKNEYQIVFRDFRFDAVGANIGSVIVRQDVFLAADGASYFSEGTGERFDSAGNLVSTVCSTATATRFE